VLAPPVHLPDDLANEGCCTIRGRTQNDRVGHGDRRDRPPAEGRVEGVGEDREVGQLGHGRIVPAKPLC
jgi:hypothetical protein